MKELGELLAICKKSLAHDPWTKKRGLGGYCQEIQTEAKEAEEAVANKDWDNLKEELGDVLIDWCHACLLSGAPVEEIIKGAREKLERRKPHIAQERTVTLEEAEKAWQKAKEQEKKAT